MKALNFYTHVLNLRSQNQKLISANLANADTPGYHAKQLDFRKALQQATTGRVRLKTNQTRQFSRPVGAGGSAVMYERGGNASLDGNDVSVDKEQMNAVQNALQDKSAMRFASQYIRNMQAAIKSGSQG